MLQIKKIELIALTILLLAGITGGQVWGRKNIDQFTTKLENKLSALAKKLEENKKLGIAKREENKKTIIEQLKKIEKKIKKTKQSIARAYTTFICSSISGIISGIVSSFKLDNTLLGVVKNNWGPLGLGAATACVTTAYNYDKFYKKLDPSPIIYAGLTGHTFGISLGMLTGLVVRVLLTRKKLLIAQESKKCSKWTMGPTTTKFT